MLIALTGVSGFIGSYTARTLHEAGHRVRALVRETSRRDHIRDFVNDWIVGDQADSSVLRRLVAGVDAVIHNSVDWDARKNSPLENFRANVMGSLELLEATRVAGVGQFIFVSSVAAYHEIPDSANGVITEETPTWPGSLYGAYKVAVEAHLKAYHVAYSMNTCAFRPAAVYGVDPKLERSQWFELIRRATVGSETIDERNGGKITHVQDVADALALAAGDEHVAGQFYNLAECYLYWQEVAQSAAKLSRSNVNIVDRKGRGPKNQFDTRKAIEFFNRHGNSTALRRGRDGVNSYVQQLLEQL